MEFDCGKNIEQKLFTKNSLKKDQHFFTQSTHVTKEAYFIFVYPHFVAISLYQGRSQIFLRGGGFSKKPASYHIWFQDNAWPFCLRSQEMKVKFHS